MKRQGIWVGGVRWQNGHYQSINRTNMTINSVIYSLRDLHIDIRYCLEDLHIDIRYCLEDKE